MWGKPNLYSPQSNSPRLHVLQSDQSSFTINKSHWPQTDRGYDHFTRADGLWNYICFKLNQEIWPMKLRETRDVPNWKRNSVYLFTVTCRYYVTCSRMLTAGWMDGWTMGGQWAGGQTHGWINGQTPIMEVHIYQVMINVFVSVFTKNFKSGW